MLSSPPARLLDALRERAVAGVVVVRHLGEEPVHLSGAAGATRRCPGGRGVDSEARQLALARAKSIPVFMSCDRAHFESYSPFEESFVIADG